jgi:EAL domain-containing protein (putative c-di-GMP-specific phosphodiesterase class I)
MFDIARRLRLRVCAEGVEDETQERLLRAERCDTLQGFRIGRPMPNRAVRGFLDARGTSG